MFPRYTTVFKLCQMNVTESLVSDEFKIVIFPMVQCALGIVSQKATVLPFSSTRDAVCYEFCINIPIFPYVLHSSAVQYLPI